MNTVKALRPGQGNVLMVPIRFVYEPGSAIFEDGLRAGRLAYAYGSLIVVNDRRLDETRELIFTVGQRGRKYIVPGVLVDFSKKDAWELDAVKGVKYGTYVRALIKVWDTAEQRWRMAWAYIQPPASRPRQRKKYKPRIAKPGELSVECTPSSAPSLLDMLMETSNLPTNSSPSS